MILYVYDNYKKEEGYLSFLRKAAKDYLGIKGIGKGYKSLDLNKLDYSLGIGVHGKPFFKNIPIKFSVSHCKNILLICFSPIEIGVDVEKIREINWDKIAKRFFLPEEVEFLTENKSEKKIGNKLENFFTIWTMKEAFSKLISVSYITQLNKIKTVEDGTIAGVTSMDSSVNVGTADKALNTAKRRKVRFEQIRLPGSLEEYKCTVAYFQDENKGEKIITKHIKENLL